MHAQEPQQDANKIETARDPDSGISVATDPSRLRESYFRGDHQQAARIVQSNKGLGVPLMPRVQLQMKHYLGHDFSDVRIHTDSFARQAVESLDANAFTVQRDIFFSANMYVLTSRVVSGVLPTNLSIPSSSATRAGHPLNNRSALWKLRQNVSPRRAFNAHRH